MEKGSDDIMRKRMFGGAFFFAPKGDQVHHFLYKEEAEAGAPIKTKTSLERA